MPFNRKGRPSSTPQRVLRKRTRRSVQENLAPGLTETDSVQVLQLVPLPLTLFENHEPETVDGPIETPVSFKQPQVPVTAPARSRVEVQTPNWSEKPSVSKQELETFSQQLDSKLDVEKIKENYRKIVAEKYGAKQYEKSTAGKRPNYAVRQKLDEETDLLIQMTHHEDEDKQDGLVTALVRKERVDGVELDVFQKRIPGKKWEECSEEEMIKIKNAKFAAEDINLVCTPGVTSVFVAEFPFKNRQGEFITTVGVVNAKGEVTFPAFHKRGAATGQYKLDFIGTAHTGVRCGVSSNKTNQLKNAVQADLHNGLKELDPILGEMTNPAKYDGSRSKMNSLMKKVIDNSPKMIMPKLKKLEATCISFDAKTVKHSFQDKNTCKEGKEVIVLAVTGETDRKDIPLGAIPTNLDENNSEKSSKALYLSLRDIFDLVFEEEDMKEFRKKIVGNIFDTTTVNTGYRSGVCEWLQHGFRRHLLQFSCRNHTKDTETKRVFMRDCFDGPSRGNAVGGDFSKLFSSWCDFQKSSKQWQSYETALKIRIAKEGADHVYDNLGNHEKFSELQDILKWLAEEDQAIFKRGDYRKYAKSVLTALKIPFHWNKTEKPSLDRRRHKNTQGDDAEKSTKINNAESSQSEGESATDTSGSDVESDSDSELEIGEFIVIKKGQRVIVKDRDGKTILTIGKLGEMSSARFFSRVLYAINIYIQYWPSFKLDFSHF